MLRERCANPFKRSKCGNSDIVLYIWYKGRLCPICSKCWKKIARSNKEWSYE